MKRPFLASIFAIASTTLLAQSNALNSSGNVGIGTTAPEKQLHLKNSGEITLLLDETGGTKYSISSRWGGYFTIWDETHPQFYDRPRFAINPGSGDVGIGTLFPNAGLEISRASSVQAANLALSVGPGASSVGDGASISFLHSGNERGYRIYERAVATHRGELRFASGNPSTGYDDHVVFDKDGNVGIGTTTPQASLAVYRAIAEGTPGGLNARPVISLNAGFGGTNAGITQGYLGGSNSFEITTADASGVQATRLMLRGASDVTDTEFFRGSKNAPFLSVIIKGDSGNVGIGTANPTHKLAVNGTIKAKEVIVETTGWSDYVFADGYALQPLSEVEAHIKANQHLPGVPSASEIARQGVSVGDMQAKLLAKIEELTLHQIAQEKMLKAQADQLTIQANELMTLRAEVRTSRH